MGEQPREPAGTPVGRRTVLGLIALGAAGVLGGNWVQNALARLLAPIQTRDPTGLTSLLPLGDTFRFYSVTGGVPSRGRRDVPARVSAAWSTARRRSRSPTCRRCRRPSLVRDFQCVTGWRVPQVHWSGVRLSDAARPGRRPADGAGDPAHVVRRHLHREPDPRPGPAARRHRRPADARRTDVTHDHGGPVRLYVAPMYGYKSAKWLSGIEVTDAEVARATGSTAGTTSTGSSARPTGEHR